jgi:cytochrome c-type biogenesis protein CcmF
MMAVGRTAANGQLFFVTFAFGCLVWAFVQSDFSVLYVANHSQLSLPTIYKVSAVWGAHEGSLLMWILILAIWTVAVSYFSHNLPQAFSARVIGVLGLLSTGFLLFTLLTSNPFERLVPAPADGADLNPLLQDPGLAIHPPILYAGYVGFSVAFAFAIAAMLSGNLDRTWAKWTRPWTTVAWLFLTIGIALGSWWAYYELGWGGWWFWDPVENASFMPWLVGTALIHSLAVTEKRGLFKSWTLLLAIAAFSLSLLGTFLVRSGILVSVHAFATDPTRGFFILGFLGIVILSALILYAWRAPALDSAAGFKPLSRETFLLLNNVLLVIAALLVFAGTLAPLVVEVLNAGKISVGAPWFNIAFAIPMIPLVLLMGLGMHAAWRSQPVQPWLRILRVPAVIALAVGIGIPVAYGNAFGAVAVIGSIAGVWIIVVSLLQRSSWCRSFSRCARGAAGCV